MSNVHSSSNTGVIKAICCAQSSTMSHRIILMKDWDRHRLIAANLSRRRWHGHGRYVGGQCDGVAGKADPPGRSFVTAERVTAFNTVFGVCTAHGLQVTK